MNFTSIFKLIFLTLEPPIILNLYIYVIFYHFSMQIILLDLYKTL